MKTQEVSVIIPQTAIAPINTTEQSTIQNGRCWIKKNEGPLICGTICVSVICYIAGLSMWLGCRDINKPGCSQNVYNAGMGVTIVGFGINLAAMILPGVFACKLI